MLGKRKYDDDTEIVLGDDKATVDISELVKLVQSTQLVGRNNFAGHKTVFHAEERKVQWDFSQIWHDFNASNTYSKVEDDSGYLIHYPGLDLGFNARSAGNKQQPTAQSSPKVENKDKPKSAVLSTSSAMPIISALLRVDSKLTNLWNAVATATSEKSGTVGKFWALERVAGPLRINLSIHFNKNASASASDSGCREVFKLVSVPPSVEHDAASQKLAVESASAGACRRIPVKVDLLVLGCDELIRLGLPAVLVLDLDIQTGSETNSNCNHNYNYNYNFRDDHNQFNEKVRALAAATLLKRLDPSQVETSELSELRVSPQNFTLFLDHGCRQSDGFYYATLRRRNLTIDLI